MDYVFRHPYAWLVLYHHEVIRELCDVRHYSFEPKWLVPSYRGKRIGFDKSDFTKLTKENIFDDPINIYPEHDEAYLEECVENLRRKGVEIERKKK